MQGNVEASDARASSRRSAKLLLLIMVAASMLMSSIAIAADGDPGEGDEPTLSAPPVALGGEELVSERTARSETFALSDGQRELRIYGAPINYLDEEGNWEPLEERLEEAPGEELSNGSNSFDVTLPDRLTSDPLRMSIGDQWVTSQYLGPPTDPADLEHGTATYESSSEGTSFEFTGLANGLKEEIILDSPSQPDRFAFALDASPGLRPILTDDGAIQFLDAEDDLVVVIPAPVVSDSAADPELSHAVHYELEEIGQDRWRMVVAVDRDWLNDPERIWPVRVDPTLTLPSPKLDCSIGAEKWELDQGMVGWRDCGSWGRQDLIAQYAPDITEKYDDWARTLLRFQSDTIPSNALVTSASFAIYSYEEAQNTSGIELRRVTKPWYESVNWMQYEGAGKPWTNPGGDYTDSLGEVLTSVRGSAVGWWTLPLKTEVVQQEVASKTPISFMLKLLDDKSRSCGPSSCTQRVVRFSSSAAANPIKRPYLSIIYEVPAPPTVSNVTFAGLTENSVMFNSGVSPNASNTSYQFEYGLTTSYGSKAPVSPKTIPAGGQGTGVTESVSGLQPNTTYHVRLSATNAFGKTVSTDRFFTTPKPPIAVASPATSVTAVSATLKGSVNPNGFASTYQFEFGPTLMYGKTYPASPASVGAGSSPVAVSFPVEGLTEGTTYHYRVKAVSAQGTSVSADQAVSTLDLPDTTITNSPPSYTTGAAVPVSFASDQSNATFQCQIDTFPKLPCTSPSPLPTGVSHDWHTTRIWATNAQGLQDLTPAEYRFHPGIYPQVSESSGNKITSPSEGEQSASHFTLAAQWGAPPSGGGVTAVTFQWKFDMWDEFRTIPSGCVLNKTGLQVAWPLVVKGQASSGATDPVFLDMKDCSALVGTEFQTRNVKFRAIYDGGPNAAGASAPVSAQLFRPYVGGVGAPTDAVEAVGPVNLDLLTGQYSISRTDVSIPVPGTEATLEFTRTYNSNYTGLEEKPVSGVMGYSWQPSAPVEQEYAGEAWTELREEHEDEIDPVYDEECLDEEFSHEECLVEEGVPAADWVELLTPEGAGAAFETNGSSYVAPEYMKEWILRKDTTTSPPAFELIGPEGTHTVFAQNVASDPSTYRPKTVSWQATSKSSRYAYEVFAGKYRLAQIIAPAPEGVDCGQDNLVTTTPGCRSLSFEYTNGIPLSSESRLTAIKYFGPSGEPAKAERVMEYSYGAIRHQLTAAWDPRISPALRETYEYGGPVHRSVMTRLIPPGQGSWAFDYYDINFSDTRRLKSVDGLGKTTVVYDVPVSGSGAPYDLSPLSVKDWGQSDYPVNATAIFPPTYVPSQPPASYSKATVHYLDPDGYVVNTVSPKMPGAEGLSLSTSETDEHGNAVRTLTPSNRLLALAAGSKSAEVAKELSSESIYSDDGTELRESLGPKHQIMLPAGTTMQARQKTLVEYDKGYAPVAGTPYPHLPTKETVTAVPGEASVGQRVTETAYDWSLRKPTETIEDPAGLNLRTRLKYNSVGQLVERRLPKSQAAGDGYSTMFTYYTGNGPVGAKCTAKPKFAGLPCFVQPAQQPTGPEMPAKYYADYTELDQPKVIQEGPPAAPSQGRVTSITYDSAGRQISRSVTGAESVNLFDTQLVYSPTSGLQTAERYACGASCPGGDTQEVRTEYDHLGRPVKYFDADGNKAETSYDSFGRPLFTSDGKGTRGYGYDSTSGALYLLEDSAIGILAATYNADGAITSETLPNGLVAKTSYDPTGTANELTYTKTASCGESCQWLSFTQDRSAFGQVLSQGGNLSSQSYSYDAVGRLTRVLDTPAGGSCTTRTYAYDANTNRTSKTTRAPGIGGACDTTSTGTQVGYTYDTADRLRATGVGYDMYGRATSLPATYAGGAAALNTTYFANDMVATQAQGAITNTYQLDANGRHSQRLQAGGLQGTEVFHYAGAGDSPAWTERGSSWSRNISGIGSGLLAIQDSATGVSFQLANMHGDIVATASPSSSASKLTATFEFDEFGNPKQVGDRRFGWLGSNVRRTELPSGVIQMGVRSYVPTIGRFLSPDPILGGSANAYEYGSGDPINNVDLAGTTCKKGGSNNKKKDCRKKQTRGERGVRAVVKKLRTRLREVRAERARNLVSLPGGGNVSFPLEEELKEVIGMATGTLKKVDKATSCDAGQALASSGSSWYGLKAVEAGSAAARTAAAKLSARFGFVAAALGVADLMGFC